MSREASLFYEFGPFRLDPAEHLLLREGDPVSLTPKAFETLRLLVQARGHLVEKEEFMKALWPDTFVEEGNLTRNISVLRKTLGRDPSGRPYIETVAKRGYRFIAPVREARQEREEALTQSDSRLERTSVGAPVSTGKHFAVVFSDLEPYSLSWSWTPRERMVATIAEYRYLAESIANQYGSAHRQFTGDGHLFLFESPDAAVQSSLKLIDTWKKLCSSATVRKPVLQLPLRFGCHFGECTQLEGSQAWVGRDIKLTSRVAKAADPDSLYVTENILDLIDVPLYQFEKAGNFQLEGDHLLQRVLYRVGAFDEAALHRRPGEDLTAEAWFLKAVALIGREKENSEEEAEYYRKALLLRPEYPEAHNNLAIVLRACGDESGAVEHYQEALRLRPSYPEAHYNYAILLESRGRLAGAEEHYRQALQFRPDYVDAHHSYANFLKARGSLAEAAGHYREALLLRPDSAEIHNNYAILLEDQEDLEGAEHQYREALRIGPDYPEAHYNYAILLENKGDAAGAEDHYREALRCWPDYTEAHNNLAILLQRKGDLAGAEDHYRRAMRLRPDEPETHFNYAQLLKAKGDEAGAEEHFRTARELAPEGTTFRSVIKPPR